MDMPENYANWIDVSIYDSHSPAVRATARVLHGEFLRCSGFYGPNFNFEIRIPAKELNVAWFYEALATIMDHWPSERSDRGLSRAALADPLLPPLDESNQSALLIFADALSKIPREQEVDEAFCCWIFAKAILSRNLLAGTLDGSLAKLHDEADNEDFETWAKRWT